MDYLELGPVHLRVYNMGRVAQFWQTILGLNLLEQTNDTTILGSKRPLIVLQEDKDAKTPQLNGAGLFHVAILLPRRRDLALLMRRFATLSPLVDGASDHLVSEAVYLTDPEGNGIEIYWDKPQNQWKHGEKGELLMATLPLDFESLIKEAEGATSEEIMKEISPDAKIGHVHLRSTNARSDSEWYQQNMGLDLMVSYGDSARFLAQGGYHHHLGLNSWHSKGGPSLMLGQSGLMHATMIVTGKDHDAIAERISLDGEGIFEDPSGNRWQLLKKDS